jgi:hypothetical protein
MSLEQMSRAEKARRQSPTLTIAPSTVHFHRRKSLEYLENFFVSMFTLNMSKQKFEKNRPIFANLAKTVAKL